MESQASEGNWTKSPRSNIFRTVSTVGLDAVTVDPQTLTPYFFFFADIDTKEPEILRIVLQRLSNVGVFAYFFETTKGYHVISPALLRCRLWTSLRLGLKDRLPEYHFDTLRWTSRISDGKQLFFEDFSKGKIQESLTLHRAIANRFQTDPIERGIETHLTWSIYKQMVFKSSFPRV